MLIAHAERYISLRQTLGFELEDLSGNLNAFARFAADRGDNHVRVSTVVDWATEASSPHARYIRLRDVARLARFLHAEDPIHEVPAQNGVPRGSYCSHHRNAQHRAMRIERKVPVVTHEVKPQCVAVKRPRAVGIANRHERHDLVTAESGQGDPCPPKARQ